MRPNIFPVDRQSMRDMTRIHRRDVLTGITAGATLSVAGCLGDDDEAPEEDDDDDEVEPDDDDDVVDDEDDEVVDDDDDIDEEPLETALLVPSLEFTFFARMEEGFDNALEEFDIEGTFYDNRNDESTQASNFEDVVGGEPDFIIISPITAEGVVPSIELANDNDIPVITVDRDAEEGEIATHVASDNVALGERSTEMCLEFMREREDQETYNIIQLEGTPGATPTLLRGEGFENVVDANDDLELLETDTGEFGTEEALSRMEDFVTAHGDDIDGVFAQNDLMALGAQIALEGADMGDVPITGVDGTEAWVEEILDHEHYGTVAQLPEEMIMTSVEQGIAYVEGEEVEEFYPVDGLEVTQENAQEYLDDFF